MEIGYHDNNMMGKLLSAMSDLRLNGVEVGEYPLPKDVTFHMPRVYVINPTAEEITNSLDAMYQSITKNPRTKFLFLLPGQFSGLRDRVQDKLGKIPNLEFLTFEDEDKDIVKILEARKSER